MSDLKNKSVINRASADLLHKNYLYPSVVHCAYYSCIQLMKHILIITLKKTELELASESRNSNEGSHELMINLINGHLKDNKGDWKVFNTNINQLKKLRVKADYENVSIDISKSNDSMKLSDTILAHLRSNIKV